MESLWQGYRKVVPEFGIVVDRAMHGEPASSTILERNFGEGGKRVNRHDCSVSGAALEMLAVLNKRYELIPNNVDNNPGEEVDSATRTSRGTGLRMVDDRR